MNRAERLDLQLDTLALVEAVSTGDATAVNTLTGCADLAARGRLIRSLALLVVAARRPHSDLGGFIAHHRRRALDAAVESEAS